MLHNDLHFTKVLEIYTWHKCVQEYLHHAYICYLALVELNNIFALDTSKQN